MTRASGASIGRRAKPQRVCVECGSAAAGVDLQCKQSKCGGMTVLFASTAEARRFGELRLMQQAGEIHKLQCHPVYSLNITSLVCVGTTKIGGYTADFAYYTRNGEAVIEDVKPGKTIKNRHGVTSKKPMITPEASLRIRLFEALYSRKVTLVY